MLAILRRFVAIVIMDLQTIVLIKSAFEDLASHPVERIQILTKFAGYNQDICVTQDLWAELISSITEITVKGFQPKSASTARNLSSFTITQFFGSPFTIQAELTNTIKAKHVGREICRILAPAAVIRHMLAIPAPAPAPAAGMPVYRR
ncbi:hypothetical protein RhiLY_09466 [Ceratobasidium sp. AG-Ba]|nr:hypothetical protein RhiLY_09466 [Ceratobasidium sp. AG-Ba]